MLREPVVAGLFYPSAPEILRKQIQSYLEQAPKIQNNVRAIISPHAGYIYSGPISAYSYKQLELEAYDTIFILSPSHQAYANACSVYSAGNFKTPLGEVEVDLELAERLIACHPRIACLPELHLQEHALEVQLPFLQILFEINKREGLATPKIVPIVMSGELENSDILKDAILQCAGDKKFLLIASSDLSHYRDYETAKTMDLALLAGISKLDIVEVTAKTISRQWEMCGQLPVLTTMKLAKELGWTKVELLKYASSVDTAGDKDSVVGYGAVAFSEFK